jgi:carboxyl-terminal processing protease
MHKARKATYFAAGGIFTLVAVLFLHAASALPRGYSPYKKLNIFARVLTYVENNYVEYVDESKLVYGAIKGMMDTLDPHSTFMPPDQYRQMKVETQGEFGGVGIEVEIRGGWITVVAPLEGTPAQKAGLKSGDVIEAIDGKSTRGMRLHEAVRAMRGARGTRVKIKVHRPREKKRLTFDIVRDIIKIVAVSSKTIAPGIGYVRLKRFQERTDRQLKRALSQLTKDRKMKGMILDLRNNPGGLLDQAVRVADLFLEKGLIVRTTGKRGRMTEEEKAHSKGTFKGFPMVCLVNEGSASAAEIVAGALQDHKRAVVLGTRTFGKGSVQTIIDLEDGSGLKLTIARYYTPNGRSIQEQGIDPDIAVQESAPRTARPKRKAKREVDLQGHLKHEKKSKKKKNQNQKRVKLKDFQLQTALDYLRAAEIFRAHE